jgi:hypothetical protein
MKELQSLALDVELLEEKGSGESRS